MSWVQKTDHGRWRARYRTPDGRTRSKTWDRKTDAVRWLRVEERKIDTGDWIDPVDGEITLGELSASREDHRVGVRPSTMARDASYLRSLILPTFGPVPVAGLSTVLIQRWVAELVRAGYAAATVRKAATILGATLQVAVDDGRIGSNPVRGVDLPKVEREEMRFLTLPELHRLTAEIVPPYRAMVYVGALAGLRYGEAAGLTVGSVDLEASSLTVTQALSEVSGSITLGPPKSKASRRRIVLDPFLQGEIEHHVEAFQPGETGLLFTAPHGGPLRGTNWRRRVWRPATTAAGLAGLRFHDLRHTHAALLIAQGEHPKAIQSRLGHSSIVVTMDRYGHLFDGTDRELAGRLGAAVADSLAPSPRPRVVPITSVVRR